MTQSSLQTQCPKCQTRFRVTDEQLGIAKGKVRCGNCMDVFNAIDHQVLPASSKPQPATSKPATFDSDGIEEDFVFADNPEEDAAEGPYTGTKLTFSDDELSDSFRSFDERDEPGFQSDDDPDDAEQVDESWAEAMLQEDRPAGKTDIGATGKKTPPPGRPEAPARRPEGPTPEAAPEEPLSEPVFREPEPALDAGPRVDDTADTRADPFGDDLGFELDDEPHRPAPADSFHADQPFGDLRREPVSVDSGGRGTFRTMLWTIIVLALLGVLVAQVTWFQFDRLSAIPELRPFYEKACQLAGCELKPLINVEAIQSRKLVVRTDPENRNQLVVDAVIINRADFEQPFPAIALTFSNLNGDVVAQSVFTPDEYLAGDGKTLTTMPPETPVRIAISIRDPGRDAVNYNILFRPYSP
ncbi:MAG TPA: DUF3426 domain-containing protein [Marinobacter sp.]|uniref:DUF3426 domain-containing protein n=1 Tax=Marinobacter sp. TaxID=50741 RepID=UPI00262BA35C|nr:DUF3426 domain-containing protein [Marinobacter sp.]HET8800848.1 DUF3426 domain-containing protein [Marinobacter sp.]